MRTDGQFDFKVVEIEGKYNKPIKIFFHGDEHYNSPQFARNKWLEDLEEMKQSCKRQQTFFVKTGDMFEAMSTSERRSYISAGLHDSNMTRWENEYMNEIDDYMKHTQFMVGKTLAVYGGNHFFKFSDGTTSDMVLASKLKAPYIGCSGYIILVIKIDKYHSHVVKIFVHHGLGSGRSSGSSFNAPEMASNYFVDADIVVMGHNHQVGATMVSSLTCEEGMGGKWKIKEKKKVLGRSGSYLKSYEPGKKSYAVDAMYRPSTLGCLQVEVTIRRQHLGDRKNTCDERWVDVKATF